MNLIINDEPHRFDQDVTLAQLFKILQLELKGSALAVNQVIIPRHIWPEYGLKDGDSILLFQAIAGG